MWDLMKSKNQACLSDDSGLELNYGQVHDFGRRFADAAGGRCLVFVLCSNTAGSAAGYIACMNEKIVPVLLNAQIDKELLHKLIERYRPAYLWVPAPQAENLPGDCVFHEYGYCMVKTGLDMACGFHDALALLLATSGSTGSPKFVRQSYENVRANAWQIAEYLQLDASERPVTTLPMNYTYGLSIINSHLLAGATILLTEKGVMQREFWEFFRKSEATSFGGVPYTYEMLERLRFRRMELPSLRCMTQAGGRLSPELHKKFAEYAREKNRKFIVMYGQCEATARMSYLPPEDAARKCGSIGIPVPGGKFALIDVHGQEITDAEVTGELVYTGPNVTMGYAEKPEDFMLGDERGGYLETGDMAKRDAEGYYYITGRRKRFLKVYGNRVNLDALDGLLKSRFGNIECACGGVDDHVCIFITKEAELILDERHAGENIKELLRKFAAEKTKLNAAAFRVAVIPEIPKSDAGKVQYGELEQYYEV